MFVYKEVVDRHSATYQYLGYDVLDVQEIYTYIHEQSIETQIEDLNSKVKSCLLFNFLPRIVIKSEKLLHRKTNDNRRDE